MFIFQSSFSQLIYPINGVYNTDTIVHLTNIPKVFSLSINGQIQLNSNIGFVKVIMKDVSGEDHSNQILHTGFTKRDVLL
jgi:hypothetical protein